MQNKIKNLTKQEIRLLKQHFQILKFKTSFDFVYESHIPNSGIVLLNGELVLFKKKTVKFTVRPGSMLGVHMLLNSQSSELGCRIIENSEIIIIHKSDIIETLANKDSELYEILKENID